MNRQQSQRMHRSATLASATPLPAQGQRFGECLSAANRAAENAPALAPDDAAAATNLAADTTLVVESAALLTDGALATGCEGAASDGADAAVEGAGCGNGSGGRGRGRGGRGRGSAHNSEQNQSDAAIAVRLSQEAFVPRVTRSGGA